MFCFIEFCGLLELANAPVSSVSVCEVFKMGPIGDTIGMSDGIGSTSSSRSVL